MNNLNKDQAMLSTISNGPIGTGVLAFRDLASILATYVKGKMALDFGCGAGRSSRLLKNLDYDVTGIDISPKMIAEAKSYNDDIFYILASPGDFQAVAHKKFDLILVSFVLMEIAKKSEINKTLSQLTSLLTKDGKIVVIAASNNMYTSDWLSMQTDYSTNRLAKSGDVVKVFLKDYHLEINDYLWSEEDCERFFRQSGLFIEKKIAPLGKPADNKAWKDELHKAPFIIYVLQLDREEDGRDCQQDRETLAMD